MASVSLVEADVLHIGDLDMESVQVLTWLSPLHPLNKYLLQSDRQGGEFHELTNHGSKRKQATQTRLVVFAALQVPPPEQARADCRHPAGQGLRCRWFLPPLHPREFFIFLCARHHALLLTQIALSLPSARLLQHVSLQLDFLAQFIGYEALTWCLPNSFAGFLTNLIGFFLPAYFSMKALESPQPQDDIQWCVRLP